MFYYIANQDFQSYKKGDIVAKFEQFVANELTSSGVVEIVESPSRLFPKVVLKEAVPAKYSKDGVTTEVKPLIDDESWTYIPKVDAKPEVPEIPRSWTKDGEVVFEQPMIEQEGWTHHPEIPHADSIPARWEKDGEVVYECPENDSDWAHYPMVPEVQYVAEYWSKDGVNIFYRPMIMDESWIFVPGERMIPATPEIPEHWVKDGLEAQFSQPKMIDPSYQITPEIKAGLHVDEDDILLEAYNKQKVEDDLIAIGVAKSKCCDEVRFLIIGFNTENKLTGEQLNTLTSTFSSVLALLMAGRPIDAKNLITSLNPDGVLVTDEMKQSILNVFSRHGF